MTFYILASLALVCVLWGVVSFMVITGYLLKRGVKVNWVLLRLFMPRYVGQYKTMTVKEAGKPGPWYYSFAIAMNAALILGIAAIVVKFL